jgi:hypothetical protein
MDKEGGVKRRTGLKQQQQKQQQKRKLTEDPR